MENKLESRYITKDDFVTSGFIVFGEQKNDSMTLRKSKQVK